MVCVISIDYVKNRLGKMEIIIEGEGEVLKKVSDMEIDRLLGFFVCRMDNVKSLRENYLIVLLGLD